MQVCTFGAGCFWGIEAVFRRVDGVLSAEVGYMGGEVENPSYQDVCSGTTEHAEVVRVEFDEEKVGYEQLLEVFFGCHDPTTLNRQGPDVGSQYRSVVFCHDASQGVLAEAMIAKLEAEGRFARPIVTELKPAGEFWRGEEYHQRYLEKRGLANCHLRVDDEGVEGDSPAGE